MPTRLRGLALPPLPRRGGGEARPLCANASSRAKPTQGPVPSAPAPRPNAQPAACVARAPQRPFSSSVQLLPRCRCYHRRAAAPRWSCRRVQTRPPQYPHARQTGRLTLAGSMHSVPGRLQPPVVDKPVAAKQRIGADSSGSKTTALASARAAALLRRASTGFVRRPRRGSDAMVLVTSLMVLVCWCLCACVYVPACVCCATSARRDTSAKREPTKAHQSSTTKPTITQRNLISSNILTKATYSIHNAILSTSQLLQKYAIRSPNYATSRDNIHLSYQISQLLSPTVSKSYNSTFHISFI